MEDTKERARVQGTTFGGVAFNLLMRRVKNARGRITLETERGGKKQSTSQC